MSKKATMFLALVPLALSVVVLLLASVGCEVSIGTQAPSLVTVEGAIQPTASPSQEILPVYYITIMGQGEDIAIYIIDPLGRHLGVDPLSGEIVNEIPDADFEDNPSWGHEASRGDPIADEPPDRLVIVHIPYPVGGLYRVQVHGVLGPQGGGLGLGADKDGDIVAMRMVNIEPGQELPVGYQFIYSLDNEELVTELSLAGE